MKQFAFKKLDAFATVNSDGNPAGYIRLAAHAEIEEYEMLQVARELKGYVNEVGFLFRSREDLLALRFFSAEREVDFCGHATIAIMYDVFETDGDLRKRSNIMIRTNRGMLKVENRLTDENAVFIMAPVPHSRTVIFDTHVLVDNLSIPSGKIGTSGEVAVINAGLTTLLVPVMDLTSLMNISPDFNKLQQFCRVNAIDIIEVFTPEVADPSNDFRVRVFAPTFGYLEDPATGSGNAAFGYYLLERGGFSGKTITIEQNGHPSRFNIVKLQRQVDDTGTERILIGGGAIIRCEGIYYLH